MARGSSTTLCKRCLYALPRPLHPGVAEALPRSPASPSFLSARQTPTCAVFAESPTSGCSTERESHAAWPFVSGSCHLARCCGCTPWCRSHGGFAPLPGGLTSPCTKRPQLAKRASADGRRGCLRHLTTVDATAMRARISVREPAFHSFG